MLSDATAKLVENYLSRYRSYAVGTDPLITNRYQHKIDRDGISYIVKKYADALRKEDAAFPEHVHCHMFRHPYVKPKTKKFITFFEVFGQLHSCP